MYNYYCTICGKDLSVDYYRDNFDFKDVKGRIVLVHNDKCDCGGEIKAGFSKTDFINITSGGDFKKFYSPDLGCNVESSKQLDNELKNRGMVNLMESKEYREHEQMLAEKVQSFPSVREARKTK